MPEEQERFHNAVAAMLNSVMFENWLRFYFLREDEVSEGKYVLSIAIPEKALDRIRERFFEFYPMAEELNGRELTLDVSRSAVCNFIRDTYEGDLIPQGSLSAYFDTHAVLSKSLYASMSFLLPFFPRYSPCSSRVFRERALSRKSSNQPREDFRRKNTTAAMSMSRDRRRLTARPWEKAKTSAPYTARKPAFTAVRR